MVADNLRLLQQMDIHRAGAGHRGIHDWRLNKEAAAAAGEGPGRIRAGGCRSSEEAQTGIQMVGLHTQVDHQMAAGYIHHKEPEEADLRQHVQKLSRPWCHKKSRSHQASASRTT